MQHDGKITLSVETRYAPFAFVDENGISRGLATEYIDLIEKRLNLRFKKVTVGSLNEILLKAQKKEIDVVNAVTKTPKRSEYLLFTEPVIEIPNVIIVRKEQHVPLTLDTMKNMKVSLVKDYAVTEFIEKNYDKLDIDLVPDDLTALLKVSFSITNAAVTDLATASYFVEQKGITNLRVAGDTGQTIKLAIANRDDWPILNQILQKGLSTINAEERNAIKNKWISFGPLSLFESREFWTITLAAISVFLLIMAGIIGWNRVLKRQIQQHTKQLVAELTERKRVEDALRESEKKYRQFVETASEGVWAMDGDHRTTFVNRRMTEILGYTPDEMLGETVEKFMFNEDLPDHQAKMTERKEGHGGAYERRFRHKNGGEVWTQVSATAVIGEQGQFLGSHALFTDITDRKQAEETLRESERNLLEAQRIARMGNWKWNLLTGEVHGSPEIYMMYGLPLNAPLLTPEALLKQTHPDDLEKVRSAISKAISEGVTLDIIYRIVQSDGSIRVIHAIGEVTEYDVEGKPALMLGTNQDITERERAEDALQESQGRLRSLLNALPDLVWLKDLDGVYLACNARFESFFGAKEKDILGKKDYDFMDKELADFFRSYDKKALEKGSPNINEEEITFAVDGHREILETIKTPICSADGRVLGVLGIGRDITERKQVKEKLQEALFFQNEAEQIARMGGWKANPETGFLLWTEGVKHILDVPPEYNPGFEEGLKFYCPDYIPLLKEMLKKALNDGTGFEIETEVITATGKRLWTEVRGFRRVTKEETTFIVGTFQDITDRKRAQKEKENLQAQLIQAQKMESIGNLAGGIAHDFNNILFPIIGLSEMLLDDFPPESVEYQNAREIYKAGQRGSDLVKQILTFSRKSEHKLMPVRIQKVLGEVLKLMRSTIPSNIQITPYIQSDCGLINANPTQIHQIFMNLITNAYHAVEAANGEISVTLKETYLGNGDLLPVGLRPGGYAQITVSDTGSGIDPEMLDKIFDPYFTTKEQGKGTGLGLAVVHGIVKEYSGIIKVDSKVGVGTTFRIYFPLLVDRADQSSAEALGTLPTGIERILLIDDEEPIIKLEKQMLERLGYHVTELTSSLEALKKFIVKPFAFDLVVSDMAMPNMTGVQLAKEMIAIRPNVPIIICTGFSERLDKEKAESMGVKGLIMKPIVKAEMAKMVREVLDQTKSQDQG